MNVSEWKTRAWVSSAPIKCKTWKPKLWTFLIFTIFYFALIDKTQLHLFNSHPVHFMDGNSIASWKTMKRIIKHLFFHSFINWISSKKKRRAKTVAVWKGDENLTWRTTQRVVYINLKIFHALFSKINLHFMVLEYVLRFRFLCCLKSWRY